MTFHLKHQAQVLGMGGTSGNCHPTTLTLVWCPPSPTCIHLNQGLKMYKKNTHSQGTPLPSRDLKGNWFIIHSLCAGGLK